MNLTRFVPRSPQRAILALAATAALTASAVPSPAQDARFRPPDAYWTLGARYRNTDTGAQVVSVQPGSAAQRAGLEPGDTVVAVDGQQVGLVVGQMIDLDDMLSQATERGRTATILLQNRRDGGLVNARVSRSMGGGGFGGGGVGSSAARIIQSWYEQYLGRSAKPEELDDWMRKIRAGMPMPTVEDQIVGSREYFVKQGAGEAPFINALFRDMLGRKPVPPEGVNWLNTLRSYGGDRVGLVEAFRRNYRQ